MRLLLVVILMAVLGTAGCLRADDGAEMVLVPAGAFTMGGTGKGIDEDGAEAPTHQVALPAFLIDRLEVTTTLYCRFLNETGKAQDEQGHDFIGLAAHMPVEQAGGQWRPMAGRESFPMTNVTWHGARAYAKWAGKRLPTEAEWEKAARGTDGRKFVWGADFDAGMMRFGQDNLGPVGERPSGASVYGCLDMAGNAWEWTSSQFKPYPYVGTDGREDAANTTERRVARGGSFTGEPYIATTTYRFRPRPEDAYYFLGFRCAKDVR